MPRGGARGGGCWRQEKDDEDTTNKKITHPIDTANRTKERNSKIAVGESRTSLSLSLCVYLWCLCVPQHQGMSASRPCRSGVRDGCVREPTGAPLYTVCWLDAHRLVCGGGGGTSRTGVRNRVVWMDAFCGAVWLADRRVGVGACDHTHMYMCVCMHMCARTRVCTTTRGQTQ